MSRRSTRRSVTAIASLLVASAALVDTGACGGDGAPATDASVDDVGSDHVRVPYDGLAPPPSGPRTPVHAESVTKRVDTMMLMFAAGEMQTSGEPFAQGFAGRNLAYYDRYFLPPDQYLVPTHGSTTFYTAFPDPFGFSTAVESYEYSKYHMNMVANQTGAGVSLVNGPLIAKQQGATSFDKLKTRMIQLIYGAGTDEPRSVDGGASGGFATLPPPTNNPLNYFGFPGLWPNLAPYKSWDPAISPSTKIAHSCTQATGYGGLRQFGNNAIPLYECDYNSLRLSARAPLNTTDPLGGPSAPIEAVIGPGILGYTTWKEALWAIDFTGRLHDVNANQVNAVEPSDLAKIGKPDNTVLGTDPPTAVPGTSIGSTPLEGMWGLTMVDEMDNAGEWLLSSLSTADGASLSGFASRGDAIAYDYSSPLRWFPTAIGVTEDGVSQFPGVASLAIADATSRAVDLAALMQGFSLFFGMTDARNTQVGQQIGLRAAFGGYLFAADDGLPDGEDTAHDRALGVMRVAFVDLDRMHTDPALGVVIDTATVSGANITRGASVTTTALGHVVIGLRHVLMACNAGVSQYGAPDPDPSKDALGVLNAVPIHPAVADAGAAPTFSVRVRSVLESQSAFVRDVLTRADGTVADGATIANGKATASTGPAALESQAAALRVLIEAFFLTQDTTYRERAHAVAARLLTAFYSEPARMFRGTDGGADDVHMTPERFAWLQSALRETYKVLWIQSDPLFGRDVLEDRMARVGKLFLNGWDDLNGDLVVAKDRSECLGGRLQLGEQALTGELGADNNGFPGSSSSDRDADCLLNISGGKLASVLAGEVHFHAP
jgi:hypothetical protein